MTTLKTARPAQPGARLRTPAVVGLGALGFGLAGMVVILLEAGLWYLAILLILAGPGFYLINRHPFVAITVWLVIAPFLMVGEGGVERRIYWIVHRALPVGTLLIILVARWIGVRKDRFPRLGWPEAMMGGYLLLTIISIAYRSPDTGATYIYMYDHVLVPLSLYMLVRLLAPDEEDLRRLAPALVFFLVAQALVGALSWAAPELLPDAWHNRENRTTGTLSHPNVYGVALLFAGLLVVHLWQKSRDRLESRVVAWPLGLAVVMAVATLSRATWLAVVFVLMGLFFVYRRPTKRVLVSLVAAGAVLVILGGTVSGLGDTLGRRLYSENSAESALSRLPVIVASLRMIEARPLVGWGYENFDRYDRDFVRSIEGLYVPDKDHASHNFFLTLGAESGLLGLSLYLGPMVWWLAKSPSGLRHLPERGIRSRKLVGILWLAMGAQVIVYNFSNNRVAFGLGVWWLTLGFLATACDWRDRVADDAEADVERRIEALRADQSPARPTDGR